MREKNSVRERHKGRDRERKLTGNRSTYSAIRRDTKRKNIKQLGEREWERDGEMREREREDEKEKDNERERKVKERG